MLNLDQAMFTLTTQHLNWLMPKYQWISSFLQQEKTNSKTFKLLVT